MSRQSRPVTQAESPQVADSAPFSPVLARNVSTLIQLREEARRRQSLQDRAAGAITGFAGSMIFVYLHALFVAAWIAVNLGWVAGLPRFDPTFVVLAMAASVEAIFLSTFVLITQNRMMLEAEKRAELDLQISLLAEHEVTQAIELLDAIAERLGVKHGPDPELEESKQDIDPASVYQAIEHQQQEGA